MPSNKCTKYFCILQYMKYILCPNVHLDSMGLDFASCLLTGQLWFQREAWWRRFIEMFLQIFPRSKIRFAAWRQRMNISYPNVDGWAGKYRQMENGSLPVWAQTVSCARKKSCCQFWPYLVWASSYPTGLPFYQSWALSVFFNFFNNKKWFYCIFFIKLVTYFSTSPI